MKRRVIQLVLLLVSGGAIVNVAVAWGFAACTSCDIDHPQAIAPQDCHIWKQVAERDWPLTPERAVVLNTTVGWKVWAFGAKIADETTTNFLAIRNGWPIPSMQWISRTDFDGSPPPTESQSAAIILSVPWRSTCYFPLRPIWPGFAFNTIFFAGILCLMFAVPLALRRRRRMQRGLCPTCAYPVGTSSVCTECGKQLA